MINSLILYGKGTAQVLMGKARALETGVGYSRRLLEYSSTKQHQPLHLLSCKAAVP